MSDKSSRAHDLDAAAESRITRPLSYQLVAAKRLAPTLTGPIDLPSIPGATTDTPLVAVSRCGVASDLPLAAHWGPEEILDTWR